MDELRFGIDGLNLPPQLLDVAVDGAVADDAFVGIYLVHKLLSPVNASGIGDQEMQQLELNGSEFQIMAVECGAIPMFIENEPLGLDRLPVARPAQDSLNPCNHLTGTEGLADVIIGAELESKQAVDFLDSRRHHNYRYAGKCADVLADLHAVAPRQHQVEKDKVGLVLPDPGYNFSAVSEDKRFESGRFQVVAQQTRKLRLVFNNEDVSVHLRLPAAGMITLISTPPNGDGCAEIVPLWASTIFLQIARPSPAPPDARLLEPSTR